MTPLAAGALILLLVFVGGAAAGDEMVAARDDMTAARDDMTAAHDDMTAARDDMTAARYGGGTVTMSQLEKYIATRYAREPVGKDALDYEIRERVLEQEALKRNIRIPDSELQAAIQKIDAGIREQTKHSLDDELGLKGMDRSTFEAIYRKQLACERMVRADLAVPAGETVGAEQQELWLSEKVNGAKIVREKLPPGAFALVNGDPITPAQVGATIRLKLSRAEIRDALRNLIGVLLVEARAKEMGLEADAKDIDAAIDRRRERFANNPKMVGITFDQLLQAKGLTIEDLKHDGGVRGEAILYKIGETAYPDEEVDKRYAAEKAKFDGAFGESRKVSWILMHASSDPNTLIKKTYPEVELELKQIAERATSAAEFGRLAGIYSTDTSTRKIGGDLGWLHRAEPGIEPPILAAVFAADAPEGKVFGPIRNTQGSALLWVHDKRPAPEMKLMRRAVRSELVGEFYRKLLENANITTYLDPPAATASRPDPKR